MHCVIQRVKNAWVEVGGEVVGQVGRGWLCLVGAEKADTEEDAAWVADRVGGLRAFADDAGKMNLAAADAGAGILVVSQFTLCANLAKGRRPSFELSMEPAGALRLVDHVINQLKARGLPVESGRFGADMQVHLVNDGPVTFVLDSHRR